MINAVQVESITGYLSNKKNKYSNLHARVTRSKNKETSLECLVALKLEGDEIKVVTSGPDEKDLDFHIRKDGSFDITYTTLEDNKDEIRLMKKIKTKIMGRFQEGFPEINFSIKRKKNEFYLRRKKGGSHTDSAKKAIETGQLSQRFTNTIEDWDLQVISGKG